MAFGMNERKGAFGEVEAIKSSKFRIKRDQTLVIFGVAFLLVGIIVLIIFGDLNTNALFYSPIAYPFDSAVNPWGVVDKEKQLFLDNYPSFFFFLLFLFYCAFCIFLTKTHKPKSLFWLWFGKPMRFIGWALNNMAQLPKDLEPKIGFDAGWFEKLEKDFFNQIVRQEDGYKREKNLKIFYDLPYIFGNTAHDNIKRLFISKESFDDLFSILEGYLNGSELYDELWIGDNDIVTQDYANKKGLDIPKSKIYEHFKAYKIRKGYQTIQNEITKRKEDILVDKDVVVFSRNAVKIFLQKFSVKFYKYLTENIFVIERFEFNPTPAKLLLALKKDITFMSKVRKYYTEEEANLFFETFNKGIEALITNKETKNMLLEMLMADFMLITFRMVIERYMGVPAGLLVSKISDYDTRMILETYQRRVLVKIVPTKNDGSTAILNSDNYTNLFICLLSSFFDVAEYNFFQELKEKFNTDITEVPQMEFAE